MSTKYTVPSTQYVSLKIQLRRELYERLEAQADALAKQFAVASVHPLRVQELIQDMVESAVKRYVIWREQGDAARERLMEKPTRAEVPLSPGPTSARNNQTAEMSPR